MARRAMLSSRKRREITAPRRAVAKQKNDDMFRFNQKLIYGHFRRHRLEALLCLIGVALGVAVVVAIDAAVNACVQSFSGAVDGLRKSGFL